MVYPGDPTMSRRSEATLAAQTARLDECCHPGQVNHIRSTGVCQKNTNPVEYGYTGGSFLSGKPAAVGVLWLVLVLLQQASLTKHPLNKVIKRHISEMLISAAALPPAL